MPSCLAYRVVPSSLVLGLAMTLCAVTSCGGSDASGPPVNAIARVEVTPISVTLNIGQAQQFAATPKNAAGTVIAGKSASWQSSNGTVASIDATGSVRALSAGTATVTATVDGQVGAATVTVLALPVAVVAITPSTATVVFGGTYPLTVALTDSLGATLSGRTVTWTSSNSAVATVSAAGLVTAVALGSTIVTATAEGRSATSLITVTPNTAVTYAVSGRVVEPSGTTGIAGARVTARDLDAYTVGTVTADANGSWTMTSVAAGSIVQFVVSATGYLSTTIAAQTVAAAVTLDHVPLARSTTQLGSLSGRARDASTNAGLSGIAVELRAGVGMMTGLAAQVTTTTADGSYAFTGIPAGTYTMMMRGTGYVQTARTVAVSGGATVANADLALSANASANQYRVVLTWTAAARDLDLYLTLPGTGTSRQQIYFLQPGNCAASPYVCLDRDASSAPGPETITISQPGTGTYRVYVHNYNAPSSATDSTLMFSGAQLRVFRGNTQVASYAVPQKPGTLWTVFELDGATGVLTPRNVMAAGAPGDPTMTMRASDGDPSRSSKRDPGLRLP